MTSRRAVKHYNQKISRALQFIPGHVGGRVASAQPVVRRGGTVRTVGAFGPPPEPSTGGYSKSWNYGGIGTEEFEDFPSGPGRFINVIWPYGAMTTKAILGKDGYHNAMTSIVLVFTPSGGSPASVNVDTGPSGSTDWFTVPVSDPTGTLKGYLSASDPLYPLEPIYIESLYVTSDMSE